MSLQSRLHDAQVLWQNDRHEGALISALIAVAATSRKRYPDRGKHNDRQAFEQFLTDASPGRISVEYRGECQPIEHIFYKFLRCQLVHEGELPVDIEITENDGLSFRAGGRPEFVLKVSRGWFHFLIRCVEAAKENQGLFVGDSAKGG
jgi:hypothetical protein